jgi:tRNA1(Val) A37 N6-methylase TrmN6
MQRTHAQPNKWTFTIPPIKKLLSEEMNDGLWCDPFAGQHSPAQVRNDLDEEAEAEYHMDALKFLKSQPTERFDGVLYDPPYSTRQASECYKGHGLKHLTRNVTNMKYWARCKDEIARILKPGGKALCFGWNSMGICKSRGFEMIRVLMVPHGGTRHDTICTVEVKLQPKQRRLAL